MRTEINGIKNRTKIVWKKPKVDYLKNLEIINLCDIAQKREDINKENIKNGKKGQKYRDRRD